MNLIAFSDNRENVTLSFSDQSLFTRTLQYVSGAINDQILEVRRRDKLFKITLVNLQYLMLTKQWTASGMEIEPTVLESLQKFHTTQEAFHKISDEWSDERIISKLEEYQANRRPTSFQLDNLRKMLLYPSAASFSVPGAGKTSEGLCYWLCRKSEQEKLLVVLPKVGFIAWEDEFEAWIGWGPNKVIRFDSSGQELLKKYQNNSDAEVYLITYARLFRNVEQLSAIMSDGNWSMILDESHNIKNSKGAYSKAVRNVGSFARNTKLILTGTPAPQGRDDLLAQAEFLRNKKMNVDECVEWIRQIKVRTTKDQLGLIPPKEVIIEGSLPSSHRRLYDILTKQIARTLEAAGDLEYAYKLTSIRRHIMDVMRAASNPSILCEKPEFKDILSDQLITEVLSTPSWKIEETSELVNRLVKEDRKVIIWSTFNENTDRLANKLRYLSPRIIRGDTPSASGDDDEPEGTTREGILQDFKTKPECMIIIANPAACGESISLHHWCHDAIYFDRSYNAGQFLQSCDRIHRYGSLPGETTITCREKEVTYYIMKSKSTIDERISLRLNDKIERQKQILETDNFDESLVEEGTESDTSGASFADREDFVNYVTSSLE